MEFSTLLQVKCASGRRRDFSESSDLSDLALNNTEVHGSASVPVVNTGLVPLSMSVQYDVNVTEQRLFLVILNTESGNSPLT